MNNPHPHHLNSKTNAVRTPDYILKYVRDSYGNYYDPCPFKLNFNPTIHRDGLSYDWPLNQWIFVNPPFNHLKKWVKKCYEQYQKGCKIILLAKTDLLNRKYFEPILIHTRLLCFNHFLTFPGYKNRISGGISLFVFATSKSGKKIQIIDGR